MEIVLFTSSTPKKGTFFGFTDYTFKIAPGSPGPRTGNQLGDVAEALFGVEGIVLRNDDFSFHVLLLCSR
jgi:hypothetical protein